jgi:hypothetical protein
MSPIITFLSYLVEELGIIAMLLKEPVDEVVAKLTG